MNKILKGIMRYRQTDKITMVKQFTEVKNDPHPKAVFFSCIDSRMIPTRFTETDVGDMFVVRNAGNLIPHSRNYPDEITTTEPAALELGCVINNVRHIIVCGHSDCKAMNLLYALRDENYSSKDNRRMSPLKAWMCAHASTSLDKFKFLMEDGFQKPLLFEAETPQRQFVAYIDPHNKFAIEDKLSQVNTLQQMQNIASYGFLKSRLRNNDLHIHAIWFDIYTGDIYYFSRCSKQFVEVNEETIRDLLKEVNRYYSTLIPGLTLHEPSLLYAYLALFMQSGVLQLLGCIGALKLNEKLLNMYWFLLLFLLFGDAFIGIVWIFRFDKMYTDLKPLLKQRLQSEYGINEEFTSIWDNIQYDFQCCGVEGPQDFNDVDLSQRSISRESRKSNNSLDRTIFRSEESVRNRVIINKTFMPNDHTRFFVSDATAPYENATERTKELDSYTSSLIAATVTMSSNVNNLGMKDANVKYVQNVPESCCRRLKDPAPVGEREEAKVEEPQSKPTAIRQRLEKKKNRNPSNQVKRSVESKEEIRHKKSKIEIRQSTTPSMIDRPACEDGSKRCKSKRHALDNKFQYRSSHVRHDSPYKNTHHYPSSGNIVAQNATGDKKVTEPKYSTGNVKIMDTCSNVNGYEVGTIYKVTETLHYSTGCEVKLKKWLRDSAHVLGVLGYCVIAFLKLCFLGILRYEIKEMIQKIKMLQGELQPPILLLSAETPNENHEINSPTSPHNMCNHLDNSITTGKHQNPLPPEHGAKSNPERHRANSVGNAFLLLQPHESGQTTPVHHIRTIQMTQQSHRLFNNILANDTGNDSDTNSHCALLIDGDDIPPKKEHARMSSNGNNNFESHELQDLLLRNSAQI